MKVIEAISISNKIKRVSVRHES